MRWLLVSLAVLIGGIAWAETPVLPQDARGVPIDALAIGTVRAVQFNATSKKIPDLQEGTKVVLLVCTTACHIAQGVSPRTATALSAYLPANTYLRLKVGEDQGLAVIRNSSNGMLYVIELQ